MASNRHLGRVIAFQTLYEEEFRVEADDKNFDLHEVLERNIDRYKETIEDKKFVKELVLGVHSKVKELDKRLQPVAQKWPLDKISRMDRIVLRISLYELRYLKDTPVKVVINEAVELAKEFGGENSSRFINGVLGTIFKEDIEGKTNEDEETKSD